ncbi:hypothetical protein HII31_09226 [Pseudocercospora fuligena]|uniref:Uncharacterized protein n=1 Tax=Pseudocercospora fuligena TaxID=685502 RepID=A0A8H6RG44_9PEZI|nr:hypothetical protein HII31_09226 [Pseudocercospora fuligena]
MPGNYNPPKVARSPRRGAVYLDQFSGCVLNEQDAIRRYPLITVLSGKEACEQREQNLGCLRQLWRALRDFFSRPPDPPTLHMFRYDYNTRTRHIAGAGEIDHQKYKIIIVTEHTRCPEALEYGYGVVQIVRRRWWQRSMSRPESTMFEVSEVPVLPLSEKLDSSSSKSALLPSSRASVLSSSETGPNSSNSWSDAYPDLRDLII